MSDDSSNELPELGQINSKNSRAHKIVSNKRKERNPSSRGLLADSNQAKKSCDDEDDEDEKVGDDVMDDEMAADESLNYAMAANLVAIHKDMKIIGEKLTLNTNRVAN